MTTTTKSRTTTVENPVSRADAEAPTTREEGRFLVPPVDIYESPSAMVVVADLPGVERPNVDVRVEDNVLTIDARTSYAQPAGLLHGEFSLADYHRRFHLTEVVDQGKISGELKNGVLTIHLPFVERAKPRKIPIQATS